MKYDSEQDTLNHKKLVSGFLGDVIGDLAARSLIHDDSKLQEPEKSMYDEYIPKIRETEKEFGYGSPQYEQVVKQMGEVMCHHFAANSHHPEHYPNGINGMSLLDLIEALADWKAASQKSGQPLNIEANKRRFGISDQLAEILANTVKEFGW
jgi:predicted metal-dependent phosphoesterase TrpH